MTLTTNIDPQCQRCFVCVFFKKIPAVHFARNEMVKRQFSVTLAQHTATFFQSAQGRNTIIFIYIQHCAKPNSALFVQITI